jgi:hypothetical protein
MPSNTIFNTYRNLELNNRCVIVSDICKKANFPLLLENEIVSYMKNSVVRRNEPYSLKDIKMLLSEIPSSLKYEVINEFTLDRNKYAQRLYQ